MFGVAKKKHQLLYIGSMLFFFRWPKKKHVASTGPEDNLQFRLSQLDGLCLDNRAGREVQPGDVFSKKRQLQNGSYS